MNYKFYPTEKCHLCQCQNQPVYNRREVQTKYGLKRVCLCDECHAIAIHTMPTPRRPEKLSVCGTTLIATEDNLRRLGGLLS